MSGEMMAHSSEGSDSGSPKRPWRPLLAFYNPRFRGLLLSVAGVCVLIGYLWLSLIGPFLARPLFPDFENSFWPAVQALKQGVDPYAPILTHGHYDFSRFYSYSPMTAWLLQPLLPLGVENAALLTLVVLQLCVVSFFWLLYRALRPVSRQEIALGLILSLSFGPLLANLWNDQVNLVLLPLCALSLLAYCRGDRWWGGAAYGLAMALKPLQPGVGLLLIWGRRTRMLVGAIVLGLIALVLPGPGLSAEFVLKVLPAISGGTGFAANAAPAGFLERLFYPPSFYDGATSGSLGARLFYLTIVVMVIGVTWWKLGRTPRTDSLGRAVEMAVAVAVSPLILTVSNTWHVVLLLIPILVLLRVGLARGDRWLLGATILAFLLIGPVYSGLQRVLIADFDSSVLMIASNLWFRIWNECQLVGMLILWLGCLRALGGQTEAAGRRTLVSEAVG